MQCSRDSLRRFLTVFLGIAVSHFGYHQTLTFGRDVSEREAKGLLNRFFRKLGRRKAYREMGAIYIMERQPDTYHIHFHVRFIFFSKLPFSQSLMTRKFGKVVFNMWNELNGWRLNRRGNGIRERPHEVRYFIKDIDVAPLYQKLVRPETIWWRRWNWKVLRKHYSPPSKSLVTSKLRNHINRYKTPSEKPYYSMAWLRKEKKSIQYGEEQCGGPSWDRYKWAWTRRRGKITDIDFWRFINGWKPWARKLRKAANAVPTIPDGTEEEIY